MRSPGAGRRLRFFLLEKIVLPLVIILLRLLMRTWRKRGPTEATLREIAKVPRAIHVCCHGSFLHALAFSQIWTPYGRRVVVMRSPSLDGQLLAALVAPFGLDQVCSTGMNRGVGGALDFIRRVKAGDFGLVAIDGPHGPCSVVKPEPLHMAAKARAQIILLTTSASHGVRFGTWDRAHLPLPFARVELSFRLLPPPTVREEYTAPVVQEALLSDARRIKSPVLPPALRSR